MSLDYVGFRLGYQEFTSRRIPPSLISIPVDGSRVSLFDSVASALGDIYPEIVQYVSD